MGEVLDYIKSVQPGQLNSDQLNQKLEQLITEMRSSRTTEQQPEGKQDGQPAPGLIQQTLQQGLNVLMSTVLGRGDLSDLDVEKS
jgi:hypothetical protein